MFWAVIIAYAVRYRTVRKHDRNASAGFTSFFFPFVRGLPSPENRDDAGETRDARLDRRFFRDLSGFFSRPPERTTFSGSSDGSTCLFFFSNFGYRDRREAEVLTQVRNYFSNFGKKKGGRSPVDFGLTPGVCRRGTSSTFERR